MRDAVRDLPRRPMLAALIAFAILSAPAQAQSVEQFYAGRSISLVIGFTPSGGYDTYARLLARHISKHIPGEPKIVPQNMPGAGSLRAAQFVFSAAPKDGTVIGTFGRQMGITPLLTPNANYDGTKFGWLGSITNEVSTCVSWHTAAVKTWDDLLVKPITFGGDGPGADPDVFALLYKHVFNAPIKLVSGYHGTTELVLAMQRGETDGLCGYSWSSIKSKHQQWLKDKTMNILVQAGLKKDDELPNVPLVLDQAKTDEQRAILKLFLTSQETARPFAAPPGIPADRQAALVSAFDATMKDAEFLAEAKKLNLDINPLSGKEITRLLQGLYATPKAIVEKASQAATKQ